MATETKPTTVVNPTPKVASKEDALKHLEAIKTKVFSYAGKSGFNPHIWWRKSGGAELEKSGNPEQLLAFKFEEPSVANIAKYA